jgi:hypothetical protein
MRVSFIISMTHLALEIILVKTFLNENYSSKHYTWIMGRKHVSFELCYLKPIANADNDTPVFTYPHIPSVRSRGEATG